MNIEGRRQLPSHSNDFATHYVICSDSLHELSSDATISVQSQQGNIAPLQFQILYDIFVNCKAVV